MVSKMDIKEKLELMSILVDSLKQLPNWYLTQTSQLTPPFPIDEVYARIEQSKRDAAAGLGQESEEMFRELEAEFGIDDSGYDL